MVVSRFMSCKTRLFSVLYSKDLIMRRVSVADVRGLARLVRTSEMSSDSCAIEMELWQLQSRVVSQSKRYRIEEGEGSREGTRTDDALHSEPRLMPRCRKLC